MFSDTFRSKALLIGIVAYLVITNFAFALFVHYWIPPNITDASELKRLAESDPTLLSWEVRLGAPVAILAGFVVTHFSGAKGQRTGHGLGARPLRSSRDLSSPITRALDANKQAARSRSCLLVWRLVAASVSQAVRRQEFALAVVVSQFAAFARIAAPLYSRVAQLLQNSCPFASPRWTVRPSFNRCWTSSAQPWVCLSQEIPHYPQSPKTAYQ
jgi:hypothetical protein